MTHAETPRIELSVQVMFYDTDCAAVVHNLAYLRHIETARTLLAERLGWELAGMSVSGLYPVVLRTEIDYRRRPGLRISWWCMAGSSGWSGCGSGAPSRLCVRRMRW